MADQPWPKAERLRTDVLNGPGLHTFTGGSPLTQAELRKRYESLAAGQSPEGHEGWLNWVVRRHDTGAVIGYVQATEGQGVHKPTAHIHPDHRASMAVAGAIGLVDTGELDANGEAILRIGPSAS